MRSAGCRWGRPLQRLVAQSLEAGALDDARRDRVGAGECGQSYQSERVVIGLEAGDPQLVREMRLSVAAGHDVRCEGNACLDLGLMDHRSRGGGHRRNSRRLRGRRIREGEHQQCYDPAFKSFHTAPRSGERRMRYHGFRQQVMVTASGRIPHHRRATLQVDRSPVVGRRYQPTGMGDKPLKPGSRMAEQGDRVRRADLAYVGIGWIGPRRPPDIPCWSASTIIWSVSGRRTRPDRRKGRAA